MLKTIVATVFVAAVAAPVTAESFNVVLLGDAPYGAPEKVYGPFETLIETINARDPELVIHIGDTKSGSTECSDQMLMDQLGFLNSFTAPTLYSPGDNEWTDCHRVKAGGYDPLERLDFIRTHYFADPTTSFGQVTAEVTPQDGYPENVRIDMEGILFITNHVVGSNNNFEPRDMAAVEEFMARDAANIAWLNAGFAAARDMDAAAVVVAIQADMFEFNFAPPWNAEAFLNQSGFAAYGNALKAAANDFGKPVLLMYGDSHKFRMFRPFPKTAPTIMALETFGSSNMHAVEVKVTPEDDFPFAIQPLLNPAVPMVAQ